jgi:hypothetical protein
VPASIIIHLSACSGSRQRQSKAQSVRKSASIAKRQLEKFENSIMNRLEPSTYTFALCLEGACAWKRIDVRDLFL